MKRKVLTLATSVALLVGCGGVDKPGYRPAADISGVAADNIIRNGDVRVYAWNGSEREILLSTKTDNYGYYVDPLQAESQFIKICVVGGEYTEEASSVNIRLGDSDRMCAITYWESGQAQETMVTPETNMAAALMEYEVKSGKGNLQNIVSNANSKIGTLFGYDILTTKPADMTSDDLAYTGLNDSVRSGLWHAAFSRIALNAAKANGQSTHTSLISSMALHKAIYRDLSADGKLDGWGVAENGKTKVRLGLGSFELNANVYRTELAKELVNFVKSDRNKTAVKANDVLSYATTHSITTDSIFDEKDVPVSFDEDAPTVAFDTPENTYISGTYTLGVKVTDFTGVKNVTYTLNDGNSEVFDFDQDKIVINTKQFNDGDLTLVLTVVDKLNNTAKVSRKFKITNTRPTVNISSKTLVNNGYYKFTANVGEVPAGVVRVEVGDREAQFTNNVISADVRLVEGENGIPVKLIDGTGAEYAYTFNVTGDFTKPTADFKTVPWNVFIKTGDVVNQTSMTQASNGRIYITPNYYALGNTLVNESELSARSWPAFKLNIKDQVGNGLHASLPEKIDVDLVYSNRGGDDVYFTRKLNLDRNGMVLIPVSEEYLGLEWYKKDDGKLITINFTDEAGNTGTYKINFEVAVSAPSVNPVFKASSKGNISIYMDGRDIEGADLITATLNGTKEYVLDASNQLIALDTTVLTDGVHYIEVKITTAGETMFRKTYEFHVDNSAPEITFTSPSLVGVNGRVYTLEGIVNDNVNQGGSGIALLSYSYGSIEGSLLQNGTFKKDNLTLQSGDNKIFVTAIDVAGNESTKTLTVLYDDDAPRFQWKVFNGKLFDLIKEDLFNKDFNVLVGRSDNPEPAKMFSRSDNAPFYLDEDNNNLQNITAGLVGGVSTAINKDGSLNLSDRAALNFLINGRGKPNKGIPHFNFTVADTQYGNKIVHGDKAMTAVDATTLKVYLTVLINGRAVPEAYEKLLEPINDGTNTVVQEYLVPITKEIFTERLINLQADDRVTAKFTLKDEAGNTTDREYEFSVFNAPDVVIPPTIEGGLNTEAVSEWGGGIELNATVKSEIGISRVYLDDEEIFNSIDEVEQINSFSIPVKSAMCVGKHSWSVKVIDLAGNETTKVFKGEIIYGGVPLIELQGRRVVFGSPFKFIKGNSSGTPLSAWDAIEPVSQHEFIIRPNLGAYKITVQSDYLNITFIGSNDGPVEIYDYQSF